MGSEASGGRPRSIPADRRKLSLQNPDGDDPRGSLPPNPRSLGRRPCAAAAPGSGGIARVGALGPCSFPGTCAAPATWPIDRRPGSTRPNSNGRADDGDGIASHIPSADTSDGVVEETHGERLAEDRVRGHNEVGPREVVLPKVKPRRGGANSSPRRLNSQADIAIGTQRLGRESDRAVILPHGRPMGAIPSERKWRRALLHTSGDPDRDPPVAAWVRQTAKVGPTLTAIDTQWRMTCGRISKTAW